MDICFRNSKLEKEFNDERALRAHRGERQAKLIMRRLSEMKAAECLAVLRTLPGNRCHELTGNLKGQLSVDLDGPYRLIFEPANDPIPVLPSGGLDWDKTTKVIILGVLDTH